jgi:hypothetical protein
LSVSESFHNTVCLLPLVDLGSFVRHFPSSFRCDLSSICRYFTGTWSSSIIWWRELFLWFPIHTNLQNRPLSPRITKLSSQPPRNHWIFVSIVSCQEIAVSSDLWILQDFQLKHLLMNTSFKKLKNSE